VSSFMALHQGGSVLGCFAGIRRLYNAASAAGQAAAIDPNKGENAPPFA
jgi:hypothetical protein